MTIEEIRKAIDDNEPPYIVGVLEGPVTVTFDFERCYRVCKEVFRMTPLEAQIKILEQYNKVKETLSNVKPDEILIIDSKDVLSYQETNKT